jgi:hypothetical protein
MMTFLVSVALVGGFIALFGFDLFGGDYCVLWACGPASPERGDGVRLMAFGLGLVVLSAVFLRRLWLWFKH